MKKISKSILFLLVFSSGALLSFAWPASGFAPLLLVAFIPLLFVEDYFFKNKSELKQKKLFLFSYITFFFWNLFTTWWVYYASPFGGVAAITCNALFMTLVFQLFH